MFGKLKMRKVEEKEASRMTDVSNRCKLSRTETQLYPPRHRGCHRWEVKISETGPCWV